MNKQERIHSEWTFSKALQTDKLKGSFYIDEEVGEYGVFGSETGFCYGLFSSKEEAERRLTELQC
jgi:hypothetical protein